MHWKRIVHAFLLGTGLSVAGVGCAAVDALVSSSAGRGASSSSPERLVAVGRVFENQGRMIQAQAMYRRALKADPANSFAKERMEFIAKMNSARSFTPSEIQNQQGIAVADAVQPRKQSSNKNTQTTSAAGLDNTEVDTGVAAIEPVAQVVTSAVAADDLDEPATAEAGWIQIIDTGWELAAAEEANSTDSYAIELEVVPSQKASAVETVGFENNIDILTQITDLVTPNVVTANVITTDAEDSATQSEWRASSKSLVTFGELAEWIESPTENQNNLLRALKSGEDDGVRALAAAMLTECPLSDNTINIALIDACNEASPLLKVTSRDTLIQRGAVDQAGVNELLSLLTDRDTDIRAQAAASLRNCAGSEWAESCVDGLKRLLDDSQPSTVAVAASTLGDFGADAENCSAKLERLLQNDNELVSEAALVSLNRVRSQIAMQTSERQ